MISEKESKDLQLKKHVGSIHCSNTLSLLQRKISNVLLYHAYDELLEKEEHTIAIKHLCQLIGYSSHDYDSIKKALKALISTVLEWNLLGDSKNTEIEDWNASSILASVGIKGGICTYAYSARLKKLLYMPEMYGRINIAIQSRFKSNYGLALYENCVRYQNLPYTRWFGLATFRKLMGVPENKYPIFRDFKKRVLDKSVAEINAFANIHIQPEIEREGQKVSRIRFKLEAGQLIEKTSQVFESPSVIETLCHDFSLSKHQAAELINSYGETTVLEKVKLIKNSHAYLTNKVHHLAAYLKSALKENYLPKQVKEKNINVPTCNDKQYEGLYAEYLSVEIDKIVAALDSSTQEKLKNDFEKFLHVENNKFVLEKFYLKGFSNKIVKGMFRSYLKEHQSHLLSTVASYEMFTIQIKKN